MILDRLVHLGTSASAKESLNNLSPLDTQKEAEESFCIIQELQTILIKGQRPFMESLDLFAPWFNRLKKQATLKPLELKDVRHFCIEVMALQEIIENFDLEWVEGKKALLMKASEPLSAIDQVMTPDGNIKTDASERLYNLHSEKQNLKREVQNSLDKLVKKHELENILQDAYVTTREGRWVLPVKSGMRHQLGGIIHASSQSKQTVFMEPQEVIPINNRIRQLDVEIEEEIERLLRELTQYLGNKIDEFQTTQKTLLLFDIGFAKAQLAQQLRANPPQFHPSDLHLKQVRHPLLVLNEENVIPNTVYLNQDQRILLLSGPNAGGKTVLLKSIGLAAQMARCGLPICADADSRIPFFQKLHIAVGDSQSVDAHLSTFAAHLKVLNEATEAQGPQNMLLIDEICGSTDPEEGTALARSFIESYAQNSVFGVITSHLSPLKMGWDKGSGIINGSLEYDNKSGHPTYQFIMGVPGQSLAIQTAQRVGVSSYIIDRAMECLSPESKSYHKSLQEVEQFNIQLQTIKEHLKGELAEAQKMKNKYEALVLKFEKERTDMLNQALKRAERKVEKLIEHAKVDETFKKHKELQGLKNQLPELVKASNGKTQAQSKILSAEEFSQAYPPGSKVFVPSLGKDGVVQGRPNAKGGIPILSSSMRLVLHWEKLKPPQQASNPTIEVMRKKTPLGLSQAETDRVVDLRGINVEEAISQLETQLDRASLNQEERVKVVHGHGTNALKRSIRSYLSRSIYVKKWSAGAKDSGGDGVTWIELS